ncbi:MAG: phospholipase [Balneolaceae bacterium]|nr:MAG: phospholipase [Balneolaceae bacterium]
MEIRNYRTIMKIITAFLLFFSAIAFPFFSHAQTDLETIYEPREYITKEGDTLRYRVMFPEELAEGKVYPLVLFLHGAGERGNDNTAQLMWGLDAFAADDFRKEHPAIVIAPQVPAGSFWANLNWRQEGAALTDEPTLPLKLSHELVLKMADNYPVDRNRLYVTGLSMGGFGTWDIITRYPGLFAAAMPICGGGDPSKAYRLTDMPIWNFHGALDNVVPPDLSRDIINAIWEAGGKPGYTEYPDVDHFSWVPAYNDRYVLEWLFSQRK